MSDSPERLEFVLASLRAGSTRAKLFELELHAIGVALKGGMIDCYTAMQWVTEVGALELVRSVPTVEEVGPILGSEK